MVGWRCVGVIVIRARYVMYMRCRYVPYVLSLTSINSSSLEMDCVVDRKRRGRGLFGC